MSDSAKIEVLERLNQAVADYNSGNVERFLEGFSPDYTVFPDNHTLIEEGGLDESIIQAAYDAGFKPNVSPRHVNIQIFGDTALITCYMAGIITRPDVGMVRGP